MNTARRPCDNEFRGQGQAGVAANKLPVVVMCSDRLVLPVKKLDGQIVAVAPESMRSAKCHPPGNAGMIMASACCCRARRNSCKLPQPLPKSKSLVDTTGPLTWHGSCGLKATWTVPLQQLGRAAQMTPPPPAWTAAWLSGEINREQATLKLQQKTFAVFCTTILKNVAIESSTLVAIIECITHSA